MKHSGTRFSSREGRRVMFGNKMHAMRKFFKWNFRLPQLYFEIVMNGMYIVYRYFKYYYQYKK